MEADTHNPMKLNTIILLLIVSISIYSSCKKGENVKPLSEVPIGEQSLAETKATFLGTWKLHYTFGGYSGTIRVNYPNTILSFTSTDSIYRWDDNLQTINSKVGYIYSDVYISNYSTYILQIENPNNRMDSYQIAFAKKGDTLILIEPHSNPEKYYLTRR